MQQVLLSTISSNPLATWNKLDGNNNEYQTCFKVFLTTLIQICCNRIVTTQGCNSIVICMSVSDMLDKSYNKSDSPIKVVTSC